jgi:hypothetical protein
VRELDRVTLTWLLPLGIAAAYLVVFVVQVPHNVASFGWESDYASNFVLPETIVKSGTGGYTALASAGQWVPLWIGLLTAQLPLRRELWEVAPTLMFVASALAVGWSVSRVADRRAGLLAVLVILVASPLALAFFMATAHNTVYPCTALVGAYLVWLASGRGRHRVVAFAVPPALGVFVGACLASDFLVAATAVIPLGLVAVLAGLRRERRSRLVALSALATVVVSVPIAKLTSSTMRSAGYLTLPSPRHVATLSELSGRAKLLFKGLKALFNGYLGVEKPGTLHTELGIASDVVMCAALLTLALVGVVTLVRFVASGVRARPADDPSRLARSLHILFWSASTATVCGAFWIDGEGPTTTHESYYATAIFAVAAVVSLLYTRRFARWAIPLGATIFFTASLVGLTSGYVVSGASTRLARYAPTITRLALADGARIGYSNYGDATALTWGTKERVIVRPLVECPNSAGANLCPGFQDYAPSWYVPHEQRSFLLFDAQERELTPVPEGLGKPVATYSLGGMLLYIYPYDIASRLGPPLE